MASPPPLECSALLGTIFYFLDWQSTLICAVTCRQWNQTTNDMKSMCLPINTTSVDLATSTTTSAFQFFDTITNQYNHHLSQNTNKFYEFVDPRPNVCRIYQKLLQSGGAHNNLGLFLNDWIKCTQSFFGYCQFIGKYMDIPMPAYLKSHIEGLTTNQIMASLCDHGIHGYEDVENQIRNVVIYVYHQLFEIKNQIHDMCHHYQQYKQCPQPKMQIRMYPSKLLPPLNINIQSLRSINRVTLENTYVKQQIESHFQKHTIIQNDEYNQMQDIVRKIAASNTRTFPLVSIKDVNESRQLIIQVHDIHYYHDIPIMLVKYTETYAETTPYMYKMYIKTACENKADIRINAPIVVIAMLVGLLRKNQKKSLTPFEPGASVLTPFDPNDKGPILCGYCNAYNARSRCKKCKKQLYCSKKCQLKDWKRKHEQECKS